MIEIVWGRIIKNEGELFRQKKGGEFTYKIVDNNIELDRTNRTIAKSVFEKALEFMPLKNTVPVQHLQAPSYVYAILMDNRIRKKDW